MTSTTAASNALNDNHVAMSTSSSQNDPHDSDLDELDERASNNHHVSDGPDGGGNGGGGDEELEEIKARVREMEEEAEKLKQMQDDTSQISNTGSNDHSTLSPEERVEIDSRSIYVGNVDYSATADDLEKHFHGCGSINRVTILCDKYTGHPKGFAYIEFADKDSVETATALDESLFKGRQIKVNAKRTNRPGLSTTNRPPRGRGLMGRGRGRGGGFGAPWFRGGVGGRSGRGFRSRVGWYGYSPY